MILLQSMKMCFTQPTLSKHYNKKNILSYLIVCRLFFYYWEKTEPLKQWLGKPRVLWQ